ncbi:MAG: VWA domain-containing protein [Acidobacteria bacterium]|nr:VWA domain-containing protein [Acidobacteriota bacterium]
MMGRRLVLFAIFFLINAAAVTAQQPTFSVAAEEVRLDVLVTQNGKPMAGLEPSDFEILDNGVPQEIQYATLQKQTPISATLVFDMSRSIAGDLLGHLKKAARGLLTDLMRDDHAALITFNNAIMLGSPPTRDFAQVVQALDHSQPFGNSSLIDASYAGLVLAESRPDPPLVIIFSDGRDTFSWLTEEKVLETAKHNDAVVYAVSTDRRPNKAFLNDLIQLTGGSLFEVESTENLEAAFLGILAEFRHRYLITYTPQGVPESGWHKLDVRVKHRSTKVKARPGYMRSSPENKPDAR